MTDGAETGVDCGGGTCAPCAVGLGCQAGSDCVSLVCAGNLCAAPTCADATKNGAETGIDCGGGCPTGCPNGGACIAGADCDSAVCTAKICQPAVCGDGARGGAEQCDDGNTASFDGCTSACLREAAHLLISEVKVSPTASEFIEIYNPTGAAVDLSRYYLADYNTYYLITQGLGAPNSSDFRVHFPAGASIPARGFVVVSLHTATGFQTAFGMLPDFDLSPSDPNAPDMIGEYGTSAGLTDASEMVILFYYDGASPRVQDVDYVSWGADSTVRVDKTGVSTGGALYGNDTAVAAQVAASSSVTYSMHRCDTAESAEVTSGAGNGLGGHDETSENGATAWRTTTAAKPPTPKGPAPAGLCP
jgi:cysteine-rich repeat protein